MNGDSGVGTPVPSLERVQEVRLLALLHDLVRQEGRTGAAAALGVHRKTVAAAVNTGRLSRRMHEALGRLLLERAAAGAPTGQAEDQQRPWEQHVATALRRQREALLAAISAQGQQLRDEAAQRTQALEQRVAALESHRPEGDGTAMVPGTTTTSPSAGAPVVTVEPAPGEATVYGAAAGLIVAWRQARDARAGAADRLTAGRAEARLRERGLSLDPATGDVSLGRAHPAARGGLAPADPGARARRAPPGGMAAPPAPGAHAGLGVSPPGSRMGAPCAQALGAGRPSPLVTGGPEPEY